MSARYVQPLRLMIQLLFLCLTLLASFRFYRFVAAIQAGTATVTLERPSGFDALLPISGLFGVVGWIKNIDVTLLYPEALVFFISAILTTLLLRRSFCSWICPVGTISEWLWKLGFNRMRQNIRPPDWLDYCLRSIKYLLLAYLLYAAFCWDFTRQTTFLASDYNGLSDLKLIHLLISPSLPVLMVLLILLGISYLLRNPFCRFICPYGALLGLVSLLSPAAVQRNAKKCVSCGVCSQVCPTGINVMQAGRVNNPECIACWRCISHCRVNTALTMTVFARWALSGILFAALLLMLFLGGIQFGKRLGQYQSPLTPVDYQSVLIPLPYQSVFFVGSSSAPQRTSCTPSSPISSPP